MNYETIIGLEVHAELSTATKIYCGCSTEFGGEPNTHCCPVCLGLPGSLPKVNKKVVEYAIRAGLATNCSITQISSMARKNYFYPDCPKDYQITQDEYPLCTEGFIEIENEGGIKKIGIERIHIEEDAGKLLHLSQGSLVDYNRAGVPLIEIVSKPDMRSPEEARLYLEKLRSILQYIGVSDCRMEEGSLRCDANISLRPEGEERFGTKTEIKNMNSFKALEKALEYERSRQLEVLGQKGVIHQETRRWDDQRDITSIMRSKEQAHDYRYFPEPDLVTINVSSEWIEDIRRSLPELPDKKKNRFINDYDLPAYDAGILTSSQKLSDFFEDCVKCGCDPKAASNWIMGEMMRLMKEDEIEIDDIKFKPSDLAQLLMLIDKGTISKTAAKKVFSEMFGSGESPKAIVKEKGLVQNSDANLIHDIVMEVLSKNAQSVTDYKNGKTRVIGFLVGQVMKASKGKANPKVVNQIIKEELEKL
ncbi:MAG TPA: Asp-tRNA(Asn)/Glu-tRNA(Gln) amidotransferase GatCAB subunit B [Clostridiaceae bacterium]|nr:Asp-tRNA(Asn)/Glu-tRNA(Gln) amidotransferase GatCAB subunit B [Clostridiaceae bacterium]